MEEKYLYMISLNKKRIVILGVSFLALFSLFFVMGMAIGIQTTNLTEKEEEAKTISSAKAVEDSILSTTSVNDQNPELLNREVEFQKNETISSSDLLSFDKKKRGMSPPEPKIKKKKPGFVIPEPPGMRASSSSKKVSGGVKAHMPTKNSDHGKRYYIQLFLSKEKRKAESILNELLKRKYKGYIREVSHHGRKHYVVRVGLYSDRNKLKKDLQLLRHKGGYKDAYVKVMNS